MSEIRRALMSAIGGAVNGILINTSNQYSASGTVPDECQNIITIGRRSSFTGYPLINVNKIIPSNADYYEPFASSYASDGNGNITYTASTRSISITGSGRTGYYCLFGFTGVCNILDGFYNAGSALSGKTYNDVNNCKIILLSGSIDSGNNNTNGFSIAIEPTQDYSNSVSYTQGAFTYSLTVSYSSSTGICTVTPSSGYYTPAPNYWGWFLATIS